MHMAQCKKGVVMTKKTLIIVTASLSRRIVCVELPTRPPQTHTLENYMSTSHQTIGAHIWITNNGEKKKKNVMIQQDVNLREID